MNGAMVIEPWVPRKRDRKSLLLATQFLLKSTCMLNKIHSRYQIIQAIQSCPVLIQSFTQQTFRELFIDKTLLEAAELEIQKETTF